VKCRRERREGVGVRSRPKIFKPQVAKINGGHHARMRNLEKGYKRRCRAKHAAANLARELSCMRNR